MKISVGKVALCISIMLLSTTMGCNEDKSKADSTKADKTKSGIIVDLFKRAGAKKPVNSAAASRGSSFSDNAARPSDGELKIVKFESLYSPKSVDTVAGKAVIEKEDDYQYVVKLGNNIIMKNSQVFSLSFVAKISSSNKDYLVVFNNSGGTGCPGDFSLIEIQKSGNIVQYDPFGNCSDELDINSSGPIIVFSQQGVKPGEGDGPKAMQIKFDTSK